MSSPHPTEPASASFRDPDGYAFRRNGRWYRAVTSTGLVALNHLERSGLYADLAGSGLLIQHADAAGIQAEGAARVIAPEQIPYVSYSSEWGFEQLKDAARTTLEIHERALNAGAWMIDATSANIQFLRGKPLLIDTLSLKPIQAGLPWPAYRQFCEHFLAPLALASAHGLQALSLLRAHPEGIPLPLASRLLPWRTWLRPGLFMHLHAHAMAMKHVSKDLERKKPAHRPVSLNSLKGLALSLRNNIAAQKTARPKSAWLDYYEQDMVAPGYLEQKEATVSGWVQNLKPAQVWDVGANTGHYSRLAATSGASVIALEADPACVDRIYLECARTQKLDVLPLVMDLLQPTPAGGWHLGERQSLLDRGRPELILALAVIHHLAIARNLPLPMIARFFAELAPQLIIEFVPKSDRNARRLLEFREDIFPHYHLEGFEQAFGKLFSVEASRAIEGTERRLYLLKRRQG